MKISLTNSLTKQKEEFVPIVKGQVGLYSCGPTVYDYPHLGNLRAYIVWDVLRRFLQAENYQVKHIMNITDVGHLTSDSDEGEDKLALASRRTGKDAWEIAEFFIKAFKDNIKDLNILSPTKMIRATETIPEQIEFVKNLESKGFIYQISDGLYFDTTKVANYGQLANLANVQMQEGARVAKNPEKKSPSDFAVWKFSPPDGTVRDMEWDSPWGKGFPGWHLECSVISRMSLGDTFDIHTGGIDHLTIHHPNEMAQSFAATGKLQAKVWLHNDFVKFVDSKMSKSLGKFITLQDVKDKGYSPLAYRFLVLQTHYRKAITFSWQALAAAQTGLTNIIREIAWYDEPQGSCAKLENKFVAAMADDLNTPQAIAVLQATLSSNNPNENKLASILKMDEVLGLGLKEARIRALNLPQEVEDLLAQRKQAKADENWQLADQLRNQLQDQGIEVQDTKDGQKAIRIEF